MPHDLTARLATANVSEHAGPTDARNDFVAAESLELFGDRSGGAVRLIKIKRQDCGQDKFWRSVSNTEGIE